MEGQGKDSTHLDETQGDIDPFARQLKSRYLDRRRADLQTLGKALRQGDFAAIKLAGHNMYGSGSAYGFDAITSIGQRLERAAGAGSAQDIETLISELEIFVARHPPE